MQKINRFDEFVNEGFSFKKYNSENAKKFIEKIKHLIKDIELTKEEAEDIISSKSLEAGKNFFKKVKKVFYKNEDEIRKAYAEVFGVKEGILCSILISFGFMLLFYYAQRKGWIDKLLGFNKGGCSDGSCDSDSWWKKSKKKTPSKPRVPEAKREIGPARAVNYDESELNRLLDKGVNNLTAAEKERLKKLSK